MEKQYQILVDPNLLLKYNLTLNQVIEAVKRNNIDVGGSYIVRGIGMIENIEDIKNIVLATNKGTPIYLRNVAKVVVGPAIRRGVVTRDGKGEVVTGVVLKLIYENSSEVIKRVDAKVAEINKILPPGVRVVPYYEQAGLVKRCVTTVRNALLIGCILVIIVLFLLLGNVRSALIVIASLPFSLLLSFILMRRIGLSANLMSLGGLAIGIGMLVDGPTVMVENIIRHLSKNNDEPPLSIISRAAKEVARPITFANLILIVVFLPLFTLQGIEGKLFSPMAYTISFAMIGSLIFSLSMVPALTSIIFRGKVKRGKAPLFEIARKVYHPILGRVLGGRKKVLFIASSILVIVLFLTPFLGTEFLPYLDEGSIYLRVTMAPSTSLNEAVLITKEVEKALLEFPEVRHVISRIGRAEKGLCPESVNNTESYVELAPRSEWKTANTKFELVDKMRERLNKIPGILVEFSQPIAERMDELTSRILRHLRRSIRAPEASDETAFHHHPGIDPPHLHPSLQPIRLGKGGFLSHLSHPLLLHRRDTRPLLLRNLSECARFGWIHHPIRHRGSRWNGDAVLLSEASSKGSLSPRGDRDRGDVKTATCPYDHCDHSARGGSTPLLLRRWVRDPEATCHRNSRGRFYLHYPHPSPSSHPLLCG